MGWPQSWCQLALDNCNGDVEVAARWIINNAGRIDALTKGATASEQLPEALVRLMDLGFSQEQGAQAMMQQ